MELCKSAANKIDQLKTEQLECQKQIIILKQDQGDSVENSVKSEIKSWAAIVEKNSKQKTGLTVRTIKEAVKSVVAEDDRSKNFIMYGLKEAEEGKQEDLNEVVQKVFETTVGNNALFEKTLAFSVEEDYPVILGKHRLGEKGTDITRPIKVQLACADIARIVVRNGYRLKASKELKNIYIAPDRTKEERAAHSKLVNNMKELIKQDDSKHYYIRNGKVNIADKALSPS